MKPLKLPLKVLLLVALPLALQIVFLTVLLGSLFAVEAEARRTERAREVMISVGKITALGKDACLNLIAYHLSHSKIFNTNQNELRLQINQEVELVRNLVGNDPIQQRNVDALKAASDKAIKLLARVQAKDDAGDDSAIAITGLLMKGDIDSTINDLAAAQDALARREEELSGKNAPHESNARATVMWVVIIGTILNILVTIYSVLIINQSISNRLAVLLNNTFRLASGKELTPPIKGTDEISQLDTTFREMAHARYEADRVKREFLEMVSHDVRTPLMSVSATLEMIGMGLRPQMLHQDVALAERNIDQVLNLLSELLDFNRLEAGKLELALEEADALTVLKEAVETVRPNAEKHGVSISLPSTTSSIMCDPDRLRQVIINLLGNSVKFSPKGGIISTSIETRSDDIKIVISDQGPGIPRELQGKIFERFGQANISDAKVHGGKGLGLAISRALIDAHKGKIGVTSEEGKGSDFWLTLPKIES